MATATTSPKLSVTPTAEELEAAAAANGTVEVVGGALISGGIQYGVYRDGVLEPSDGLSAKVDFMTGKPINSPPFVEGTAMYTPEGKEPIKTVAKKQVRTRVKTAENIDLANAMTEDEEAAQLAAEEAANAPAEPAEPPPEEPPAPTPAP
jgi:hypothetical protein